MFRGKESSNRIELSQLVQELLNFGVFGFLWLLGVGLFLGGGWGGWGVPLHMCTQMCMHACTCMHGKHGNFMQMATPLGESLGIPYDVIHTCMHMHMPAGTCMCTWVGVCPLTTPNPHPTPPTPLGGTPRIIQNSIALELIEIFQFCLKI